MNLSVQNVQPLDLPNPIQLLQETKVINQTGHPLALAVAIYSLNGTEIENAHFFPNEEGHFIIPKPPYGNPEYVQVSLFWYQGGGSQGSSYERHLSFVELFQNENYPLG